MYNCLRLLLRRKVTQMAENDEELQQPLDLPARLDVENKSQYHHNEEEQPQATWETIIMTSEHQPGVNL
jgi:hypothetical protein